LHALIHPKGCRSHLEDKRWRIIRQVHQSWVIRKAVRYSDDLWARYVYVEPENIAEYLKVLITWYNSELQLHPLIKIMLFSLYFGACQWFCVNGFFGFS
jgi:Fic family protein